MLVAAMIAAPDVLAPYDPLQENPDLPLAAPSLQHPFGTDYIGRDLLSRVVAGTAATIAGSFIAVLIGLLAGTVLGLLAAYFGRATDSIISRIVDVLLSIPTLLLSITIIVALGFGTVNAAIAVGVSSIAVFARLARSEVLATRNLPFVEASAHLGSSHSRLLFRHVLPNSYSSVLSLAALQFGTAILAIASLSFLGYGAQPPEPEWGLLISEGRNYINSAPSLVLFPSLAIVLSVMSLSRLAHIVRRKVG
ncbi:ABC transporter permease [Mycolicibacterium goodii]|uniref:ABC transporter permease n=1 Tax=Mycolicibacterium goodii TaxID=134601 RepID=UPI00296FB357